MLHDFFGMKMNICCTHPPENIVFISLTFVPDNLCWIWLITKFMSGINNLLILFPLPLWLPFLFAFFLLSQISLSLLESLFYSFLPLIASLSPFFFSPFIVSLCFFFPHSDHSLFFLLSHFFTFFFPLCHNKISTSYSPLACNHSL